MSEDKTYHYRPGSNDNWVVYGVFPDDDEGCEDWAADVVTEFLAINLVKLLQNPLILTSSLTSKARAVSEVTVIDPISNAPVNVSIYRDKATGGMFGVDSSWIEQTHGDDDDVVIPSPFNSNSRLLLTDSKS